MYMNVNMEKSNSNDLCHNFKQYFRKLDKNEQKIKSKKFDFGDYKVHILNCESCKNFYKNPSTITEIKVHEVHEVIDSNYNNFYQDNGNCINGFDNQLYDNQNHFGTNYNDYNSVNYNQSTTTNTLTLDDIYQNNNDQLNNNYDSYDSNCVSIYNFINNEKYMDAAKLISKLFFNDNLSNKFQYENNSYDNKIRDIILNACVGVNDNNIDDKFDDIVDNITRNVKGLINNNCESSSLVNESRVKINNQKSTKMESNDVNDKGKEKEKSEGKTCGEKEKLKKEKEELEKEKEELKKEKEKLEKEKEKLEKEKEESKVTTDEGKEKDKNACSMNKLNELISHLKKIYDDRNNHFKNVIVKLNEEGKVSNIFNILKDELTHESELKIKLYDNIYKYVEENEKLTEENKKLTEKNNESMTNITKLTNENTKLNGKLFSTGKLKNDANTELKNLKEKLEKANEELKELKELKESNEKLEKLEKELNEQLRENEKLIKQLNDVNKENIFYMRMYLENSQTIENLKKANEDLEKANEDLKEENNRLKEQSIGDKQIIEEYLTKTSNSIEIAKYVHKTGKGIDSNYRIKILNMFENYGIVKFTTIPIN